MNFTYKFHKKIKEVNIKNEKILVFLIILSNLAFGEQKIL